MANGNGIESKPPVAPGPKLPPRTGVGVGLRVSLIPAEEQTQKDPTKGFHAWVLMMVIGCTVLVLITAGIWARVFFLRREVAQIDMRSAAVATQEDDLAGSLREAKVVQNQLRGIAALLSSHRYATNLLAFLEKYTLPTVAFSNATIAESGMVTLSASADDYESFAAQIGAFRSDPLTEAVTVSGISAEYNERGVLVRVQFTISVTFNESLFRRTEPVALTQ